MSSRQDIDAARSDYDPDISKATASRWETFAKHADNLDALACENERLNHFENAARLRNDAAWYRNRFGGVE